MPRASKAVGVGRAEAAKALGVTPQTVNRLVADGAPLARRGRRGQPHLYDVERLLAWRAARDLRRTVEGVSLEHERSLLAREQRLKLELENARRRGELIEADDVRRQFADIGHIIKAKLRAIPNRIAPAVVSAAVGGPAPVAALLLREIDAALQELADRRDEFTEVA